MSDTESAAASGCLFCRIIEGSLDSDKIWEDEHFLAIKDIYPKAPLHVLVLPKRHLASLNQIGQTDGDFCQKMLAFVVAVAEKLGVKESGYRVITNVGSGGGQMIFHLHWHLLAGKPVGFSLGEQL